MNINIPVGKTSHATVHFVDSANAQAVQPAGSTIGYRLMDDAFNVPQDKGFVTVTPSADGLSADVTGIALGSQNLEVGCSAFQTPQRFQIDTHPVGTAFNVSFSPAV